jgi:hypothetical protein
MRAMETSTTIRLSNSSGEVREVKCPETEAPVLFRPSPLGERFGPTRRTCRASLVLANVTDGPVAYKLLSNAAAAVGDVSLQLTVGRDPR